ncbi:RNA 2',3'-cyclic phosphodiesterase [Oscillospiraceae bacterium LTW-04]|nr:RNA 2',3'-cyclic phosphodiesterase [Oscillospiraceae bacterium MB24-C1]
MRLFIAINFDEEAHQNILAVQQRLRELGMGNFSRPENLHLTLAFLGEVASERVDAICDAMNKTAVQPMTLTFDHVGRFKRDGGDLWWIGLAESRPLLSLQKELSDRLADAGFRLDDRRFAPHITLAREVRLTALPDRGALLGPAFSTQINVVSLMRSERISGKLIYTEQFSGGVKYREY